MILSNKSISAFDPEAIENAKAEFEGVTYREDQYEVLEGADALCILTEWSVFRTPDYEQIKSLMKSNVIFDGRNLYDLQTMEEMGFYYNSVGREIIGSAT